MYINEIIASYSPIFLEFTKIFFFYYAGILLVALLFLLFQ